MNSSHSILHEGVIGIAIEPTLSRFGRSDHGMLAQPRVLGRVAVRRVIATARRATFLAYAQMDPTSAHFYALIALTAFGPLDGRDRLDMSAACFCHGHSPLIRTAPDERRRSRSNPRLLPTRHA